MSHISKKMSYQTYYQFFSKNQYQNTKSIFQIDKTNFNGTKVVDNIIKKNVK